MACRSSHLRPEDAPRAPGPCGTRTDPLEELVEQGRGRPALLAPGGFADLPRATSTLSTAEILDDVRGRW